MKTKNDVHVGFAAGVQEPDSDVYEIVIGGWSNTESVIRRGKQGTSLSPQTQVTNIGNFIIFLSY